MILTLIVQPGDRINPAPLVTVVGQEEWLIANPSRVLKIVFNRNPICCALPYGLSLIIGRNFAVHDRGGEFLDQWQLRLIYTERNTLHGVNAISMGE